MKLMNKWNYFSLNILRRAILFDFIYFALRKWKTQQFFFQNKINFTLPDS